MWTRGSGREDLGADRTSRLIDPLIMAFENDEERVRTRAMELIEQDWARAGDLLE